MHQQSLEDVVVTPQVRPPHAARVVQVRVRTFQEFATFPQQPLTAFAVNPAPIRVHRVALGMLINPVLRRTIRFTDVSAEAHVVELPDLRPAVIALVGHDLARDLDRLVRGLLDRDQLLDGFRQRLIDRRGVALVGALHRDDHDARLSSS